MVTGGGESCHVELYKFVDVVMGIVICLLLVRIHKVKATLKTIITTAIYISYTI